MNRPDTNPYSNNNTNDKDNTMDTIINGTFQHVGDDGTIYTTGDYETVGKAYAASGFTGRLVKAPEPATAPAVPEPGTVTPTVATGVVSQVALARQAEVDAALRALGIAPTPPVYAAGSVVHPVGVDNFRISRQEWSALPTVDEGVAAVVERIRAEKRKDILVKVTDLRMNDDGTITRGTGDLGVERNALRQLLARARVFPDAFRVMEKAPPAARAAFFNDMVKHYGKELGDARMTIRARVNPATNTPQAYAVVGPGYAAFDADRVAAMLPEAFRGRDARAEIVYDPASTSLKADVLYHADHVTDLSAGDVFKGGLRIGTADDASSSIYGGPLAYRNLCLNLIIIATETADMFRRIHRGSVGDIAHAVANAADRVNDAFDSFAHLWGRARTPVSGIEIYGGTYSSVPDALTALVDGGRIDLGVARDTAVEWLLAGYDAEPGDTFADVLNAVTRVHSLEKVPAWAASRAEGAAGRILSDVMA